ncbi:FAD binding domain protein [Colletotrichum tofieldiae]|nr:FAD binding domain protein [Colletotrichum tofieldiae]
MTVNQSNVTTLDGVVRSPQTGIQVVIVGAGIGGLMTALECWRKGNDVIVLEKTEELSAVGSSAHTALLEGDVVVIGPSAWATLHNYPSMAKEYDELKHDVLFSFCSQHGELLLGPQEIEWNWPGVAKHASYPTRIAGITIRQDVAAMLYNQAKRLGIKVEFGINVVEYSEEDIGVATVRSSDGRKFTGDLVVAADGLGTKSHAAILGKPIKAIPSGYACIRGSFPTQAVQNFPAIQAILPKANERPKLLVYTATKTHLILTLTHQKIGVALTFEVNVRTPYAPNAYYIHKDDGTAEESWSKTISGPTIAAQLTASGSWDPAVIDCFNGAPDGCIVSWKLCWRDPQPKWTSSLSRVIQLGDSAHSFLPTSANGATMAAEDALSLAECLRNAGRSDVPMATRVHEKLREARILCLDMSLIPILASYERVSLVQKTGFVNRREMHRDMKTITQDGNSPMLQGKWIWSHNPELYAKNNFCAARAAIEAGTDFENTNLPPGHKWESWTMEKELEKEATGVFLQDLKNNGDWGVSP